MMTREQSIRATFDIFKPNGVIEVRAMNGYTYSGYFRNREKLISELARHDDKTWYFVMNDIDEGCYSREQNERILSKKGLKTTGDKEITAIKWILIDADPERTTGVSSTDEEKAKAKETIKRVYKYLRGEGFSDPVVCDSGNGYHLLYSVDMAIEDAECTKKFLQAIDMLFSDDAVKIDTSVFNPSRITKVYGTIARKGANTAERPHRASNFVYIPENILPNSIQLLKKVIGVIPEPPKPIYRNDRIETFDIDKFIADNGIAVSRETTSGGIRKIVLEECPFDSSHKSPDSAIFVMQNGAIAFKCFHNSCADKRWSDVRQLFDPNCYERRKEQNRTYQLPTKKIGTPVKEENGEKEEKPHFLRMQDIEIIDRSKIVSIKTGIDALDKKLIGMNKGELSIWSGGNGSGKSTFLSQLALESISRGFNVAMFSGELTSNRAKSWLQLQAAGRAHTRLSDNGVSYYVPKEKADAIDEWAADKLWIYNNQYGIKVNSVIEDFEKHMEQHHTDVVIIDNLMSLDLSEIRGEKYDRQTTLVLTLSEFAKKYDVHIHFVCHPRKPVGFLRKSDISGTADLTNAADNVFMMHRVNQDFLRLGGEFLGQSEIKKYEDFTNVIEIMKNRDLGVSDEFVGVYYEPESKRMLNYKQEYKRFGWKGEGTDDPAWLSDAMEQDDYDLPL